MKIIIVGEFLYDIYEKALSNAFTKLGCSVVNFAYSSKSSTIFLKYLHKIEFRLLVGPTICLINIKLILLSKKTNPDLIILYRATSIWQMTISRLKKKGVKIFSINNDDPFNNIPSNFYWRNYINVAKVCDHNFVYRQKNIKDFLRIGIHNSSILLPYYYSTTIFPINCQKENCVAFIGHYENDGRDLLIKELIENDIPIKVFGDSAWKTSPNYKYIHNVIYPEKRNLGYNILINNFTILLVFYSKINSDKYTRRCFEIPATRSFMICPYSDEMNHMFPENICAVYYRDIKELIKKCKYYLNNQHEIESIATNSYNRIHELGASEIHRAKEILNKYEQFK